jgi:hypothetical protein
MVITVTRTGGFPVHAFVAVTRSSNALTKSSIVNHFRAKEIDFASSRIQFRGNSVNITFDTPLTSTYNIHAITGDARGTLSEISSFKTFAPYYTMATSTIITNGIGSTGVGIQSDKLSNTEPVIVMTCIFTLTSGNYGFQMGFKSATSGNADNSPAGNYHSADISITGPNRQVTVNNTGPVNVPVEAVMRYVRSEKIVYFTAKNLSTNEVFVIVKVSNTTWNVSGTHAGIRTFYGPMQIQKFEIAYA